MIVKVSEVKEFVPPVLHFKAPVKMLVGPGSLPPPMKGGAALVSKQFVLVHTLTDVGGYVTPHIDPSDEAYYIIKGRGIVRVGEEEAEVEPGMTVFIPANVTHEIKNAGSEPLEYLTVTQIAPTV